MTFNLMPTKARDRPNESPCRTLSVARFRLFHQLLAPRLVHPPIVGIPGRYGEFSLRGVPPRVWRQRDHGGAAEDQRVCAGGEAVGAEEGRLG